jgi:uncharacterized phage protein (TIGR02218 family)
MKPCSAKLLALLKTRDFYVADLYSIWNIGGDVGTTFSPPFVPNVKWCSGDRDVIYNGQVYHSGDNAEEGYSGGPYVSNPSNRFKAHFKIGLDVDSFTFDVFPGSGTVIGGTWQETANAGGFDNCLFTIDRAFMPSYGNTAAGVVNVFTGTVAEVTAGRSFLTFTVNSFTELLARQWPRNLISAGCMNTLGDWSCMAQFAPAVWPQVTCTVVAGSTANVIFANISNPGFAGYYDLGKVVFQTGALTGSAPDQERGVRSCSYGTPGEIVLATPFTAAPAAGDTFILFAGCDKSLGQNGCPKFNNTVNFRGLPFVPQPITAV